VFILARLIDLYSLLILAAVILSWVRVPRGNPIVDFIERATEPAFGLVRRVIPPIGGIDLSPIVILFALRFLKRMLY
jgi:YggT family protein